MSPGSTESTPLLHPSRTNATPNEEETDYQAIFTTDLHDSQRVPIHLTSSYRRPSFVAGGGRGVIFASSPIPESALHDDDVFECVREESALVKQNDIIDGAGMWRRRDLGGGC